MVNSNEEDDMQQDREEATEDSIPMMSTNVNVTDNIGGIKGCRLILDCVTRWGSTYKMIARAVKMEAAIEEYTLKYWSNGIVDYQILPEEWNTLKDINTILEPFTDLMSLSMIEKNPSLPFLVPYYNELLIMVNHGVQGMSSICWLVPHILCEALHVACLCRKDGNRGGLSDTTNNLLEVDYAET